MLRRALLPLTLTSLATAGLTALAAPAAAAPAGPLVQAETLKPVSGRALVFADPAASAGRALAMVTNGAVRAPMTTTTAANRVVLRVRGDQAYGAPRAEVLVDGARVGAVSVSSTRWVDAVLPGSWAPGKHTVEVRFVNDAMVRGRDRNLRLDRITFGAGAPTASGPAATSVVGAYESRLHQLVNAERTARGLRPLAPLACATTVARDWSTTMARTGAFQHRDLDQVRAACASQGLRGWGENIAFGDRITADAMMKMWMESPGHRANILSTDWTHVGNGIAVDPRGRVYGTQNFFLVG